LGANQTSAANGMNVPFFVHAVGGELHLGVTQPEPAGGSGFAATRVAAAVTPEELHIATPNGSIMLVGDTNFVNSRDATFSTGGRFIVATADPDKIAQGNITVTNRTPNVYNCAFASGCIPDQGNHFVFTREMTAIVDIGNATRVAGEQNPQFTVTQTGLRTDRGDTMSDLTTGKPVTTAGVDSAAGSYPIMLDSTFSPARYTLVIRPGVLQVEQRPLIPDVYLVPTDTPAGSLSVPQICTSIAPAPIAYSDASAGDAVDRDWSRIKQRLVLSTCTGVRMKESCGDF
jgi:hypothetical protein